MTLPVVLSQAFGELEEPITSVTVIVVAEAVFYQVFFVCKVGSTVATIMMSGTLDVVLFETQPSLKVLIAVITGVVLVRVCDVLAVRVQELEVAVAAIAVGHQNSFDLTVDGKEESKRCAFARLKTRAEERRGSL